MKLPNLRLSETQATASLVLGIFGLAVAFMLAFVVLRGIDIHSWVIPYNPKARFSAMRPALIYVFTAVSAIVAITASILGFSSLGHRRNNKQGYSWLGMLLGALVFALAVVLFFAWRRLSEAMIMKA